MLKVGDIREFIRLMDETSIHELQVEAGDVKLILKKAPVERVLQVPSTRVDAAQATSSSAPARMAPPRNVHGRARRFRWNGRDKRGKRAHLIADGGHVLSLADAVRASVCGNR